MNYEEKYKEALERAKKLHDSYNLMHISVDEIEQIFPELKESEDERIMSRIIDGFKNFSRSASKWNNIPVEEVIAYLEKQKDKMTAEEYEKSELFQLKLKTQYHNGYQDGMVQQQEKPKAQKPWKVGANAYFTPEQKPDTRDDNDLQLLGFIYDLLNEIEWKDNWAMSKDVCLRRLNNYRPQKPELSEEDEILRVRTINRLETLNFHGISGKEIRESIDWLKSLSLNLKKKNEDVAKLCSNEWSEEDERKYQCIRNILLTDMDKKVGSWKYSEILEWYEKRGIGRYTNSKPHWKPSEEQMKVLQWWSELPSCPPGLKSLYEDLKKLKGEEEPEYYQH